MKKITAFNSYKNAVAALDNGGRFYNIFTAANDGEITSQELAKAAGVFSDKQKMILYFELSLSDLQKENKERVILHLSRHLQADYKRLLPSRYTASEAKAKVKLSEPTIITGIPKLVDSKTKFSGFIMIPITTNNVTTFVMVPIHEQYDIYELRDENTGTDFFIAHTKSGRKLPERLVQCAGVIKELKTDKKDESKKDVFLEVVYYL